MGTVLFRTYPPKSGGYDIWQDLPGFRKPGRSTRRL